MSKLKTEKTEKFETLLEQLEELVGKLDAGELSLEDSLKSFESGMTLVKACEARLNEAQKRVEILMKDKDGKKAVSFEVDES